MKKRTWILGMVFMLVVIMTATMTWVDSAEMVVCAENGGEVSLAHIHAGSPNSGGGCYTTAVYHSHSGSSSSGGGCYGIKHSEKHQCGSYNISKWEAVGGGWNVGCGQCGARWWQQNEATGFCTNMVDDVYYELNCGKENAIESYKVGCGYSTCGSAYIVNQDTSIAKETSLACEVISEDAGCHVTGYAWSNGDSAQTITVRSNGTYTCNITYTDDNSGEVGSAEVSITISNIDNDAPIISANQTPEGWTKEAVLLTATAEDSQSGLDENAYSWDGSEWLSSAERSVTENGSYTLRVRDRLENQSEYTFTVNNIDNDAPIISANQTPEGWTKEAVLLTATAEDSQSGLDENAYSWDGSEWLSSAERSVTENGSYTLRVRDRLENQSEYTFTVTNIDNDAPIISANQTPEGWTKEAVLLTATAEDSQSGLDENAYSWDGSEWLSSAERSVTENGSYTLRVRDQLGNQSEYMFTVFNIDQKMPVIESWTVSTEALTSEPIKIIVQAGDYESGLAKQAYSLDGAHWQSENVFMISENGTYNIYVRDKAGNTTSLADKGKSIVISNIRKPESKPETTTSTPVPRQPVTEPTPAPQVEPDETGQELDEPDLAPQVEPELNMEPIELQEPQEFDEYEYASQWGRKDIEETQTTSKTMSQIVWSPSQPASVSAPDLMPKIILSISIPRASVPFEAEEAQGTGGTAMLSRQPLPGTKIDPRILRTLAAAACICCLGFFCALLLLNIRGAALYQVLDDGKYHFIDRLKINRRSEGEGYVVKITDRQLAGRITESVNKQEQAVRHYILKFGRHFAKWHKEEKLEILLCTGDWMYEKVEREVKI